MKMLVTGCAGFIGSHLTDRLLSQGNEVIGIDCFTDYYSRDIKQANIFEALQNGEFKLIEKDILNMENFPDVDVVFHMAAQAGVRASWGESFHTYTRNNIDATQRLLEAYKDSEIKRFVYASSSSIYGNCELPMKEDSMPRPLSPYGVTKLAGEQLCFLYYQNYKLPTVALRYFTVYGPRQRPDMAINKFVKAALQSEKLVIYGDGKQTRDFTYVDDIIDAILAASRKNVAGDVFNIGGGSRISIYDLIEEIGRAIGMAIVAEKSSIQKGDVKDTQADISKADTFLHWAPQINIKQGLRHYIDWLQKSA